MKDLQVLLDYNVWDLEYLYILWTNQIAVFVTTVILNIILLCLYQTETVTKSIVSLLL